MLSSRVMNRSISLKIATLICHALIIIGMGHGFAPVGFLQFFYVLSIFSISEPAVDAGLFERLMIVGSLLSILGDLLLFLSFARLRERTERMLLIAGVLLLWLALFIWKYATIEKMNTFISVLLMLPFAYCCVRMFWGRTIHDLFTRLREKV